MDNFFQEKPSASLPAPRGGSTRSRRPVMCSPLAQQQQPALVHRSCCWRTGSRVDDRIRREVGRAAVRSISCSYSGALGCDVETSVRPANGLVARLKIGSDRVSALAGRPFSRPALMKLTPNHRPTGGILSSSSSS